MGAAVIKIENKMDFAFFVESRDQNKTLEILKKQAMEKFNDELVTSDRNGINVYSYKFSHSLNFIFFKYLPYLFNITQIPFKKLSPFYQFHMALY